MRNLKWIPFVCLTLNTLFASGDPQAEFQIKKFRFNRHLKLGFERLVLEFSSKGGSKESPTIRLVPDNLGKETTIHVSKASLVGAIPESSINEAYTKKSQYFGPISINTDTTAGFEVRTFTKQSRSIVDAFWLQNPPRLIVDVFPKDSDRAMGPNVVQKRSTASVAVEPSHPAEQHGHPSSVPAKSGKDWTEMEKPGDDAILCFPANAQVRANIGFEKGVGRAGTNVAEGIDNTFGAAAAGTPDTIVCYPKGAQVTPLLKFQPEANGYYGRADGRQPSSVAPAYPNYSYPPMAPQMGYPGNNYYMPAPRMAPQSSVMGRDQVFNNEADVALSLPDDENLSERGLSSTGLSSGDNFNQKAPPLSLGKRLPSPFKSKQ